MVKHMARKRKTKASRSEWSRIFATVSRKCSAEARRRGIKFQKCVAEELAKYR